MGGEEKFQIGYSKSLMGWDNQLCGKYFDVKTFLMLCILVHAALMRMLILAATKGANKRVPGISIFVSCRLQAVGISIKVWILKRMKGIWINSYTDLLSKKFLRIPFLFITCLFINSKWTVKKIQHSLEKLLYMSLHVNFKMKST